MQRAWLCAVLVAGCVDIQTDPGEGPGQVMPNDTVVEFDPSNSIIPFPNNLILDPATGKVNLPAQCGEGAAAMALRTGVIDQLDGFGTYEAPMQVTFSKPVDPATLDGKILLYKRTANGMGAQPVPILVVPTDITRYDATCTTPATVSAVVIIPKVPLEEKATYDGVVIDGVAAMGGAVYGSTATWELISGVNDPVQFAADGTVTFNQTPLDPTDMAQYQQLVGIDTLWKAHKNALDFLEQTGAKRSTIRVAWELTTQTTTDPLDPSVAGSLAANVNTGPLLQVASVLPDGVTPTQFLTANGLPCGASGLPCDSIGDIIGAGLVSKDYQQQVPNPLTGLPACVQQDPNNSICPVPGAWSDPLAPTNPSSNVIQVLATVPTGTPPATGWPTIVFGHGLGSSKTTMLAIAPQLAAEGYATVAIDFVNHSSRAIRTSTDASLGCANDGDGNAPAPTDYPQCYAAFLSPDLAATRDNIRQTVLDLEGLVAALRGCGTAHCGALQIDYTRVGYIGISLGGIIGTTTTASLSGSAGQFKAAVLNVPGVGLLDILENTANLEIRCSLVNSLIDAGVVTGDKWTGGTTGLCTTDAWKEQPSYQAFAQAARWVLDAADGANFTTKLATQKFLIQEVVNDQVVPNVATDNEGMLVGLTPGSADMFVPPTFVDPSAVLEAAPQSNTWVRYTNLPADPASGFPGNTFAHPSLLQPADGGAADGQLGTLRLQTDALFFMAVNNPTN
ncbi:MAG TPA: hypothetical protein VGM88_02900 [Kofleriaceae bacterium]|jgi:pimeloyl-ACP methyl ester carboxylesterase